MRIKILELSVDRALSNSGLPGIDYALNPYVGCIHGCLYCYAKMYTSIREIVDRWGEVVAVKKNLIDVLLKEIKKIRRGVVGLGTITDPYQPVEAVYKLTRKAIEVLTEHSFRVSIQTKSSLVLRDVDILLKYRELVDVGITITYAKDSSHMRMFEPYSSPPSARINTLRKLSGIGIKTWIFFGPVIPGYNDDLDEVRCILEVARYTGSVVYVDKFRIKKFMWTIPMLKTVAIKSSRYNWHDFYLKVFKLCKDMEVECRHGFEGTNILPSSKKKLDNYMEK